MSKLIRLRINKWDEFQFRKDVKQPSWFRLEHEMIFSDQFYDFTDAEFKAWIYVLSLASKQNSGTIILHPDRADALCRIKKRSLLSAIEKLQELEIVTVDVTPTLRARTFATATRQDITEQDKTLQDRTSHGLTPAPVTPEDLFDLWNEKAKSLPKAEVLTTKRKQAGKERIREKPDLGYWTKVIERIEVSGFCRGSGTTGWKATFDWLLQPDTHVKVLEGKYDDRTPGQGSSLLADVSDIFREVGP